MLVRTVSFDCFIQLYHIGTLIVKRRYYKNQNALIVKIIFNLFVIYCPKGKVTNGSKRLFINTLQK